MATKNFNAFKQYLYVTFASFTAQFPACLSGKMTLGKASKTRKKLIIFC